MSPSERKARIEKLKRKIDLSKKTIENPPEAMVGMLPSIKESLAKAEEELAALEKEESEAGEEKEKEKEKEKEESGKKTTPAKTKKEKKAKGKGKGGRKKAVKTEKPAKPSKQPKKFVFEGKEISEDDVDYCEKLLAALERRRTKRRASQKKFKTKSVMQRITDQVGNAVETAIDNLSAKEIATSPKQVIGKIDTLKKKFREFLEAFKSLLGKEYKKSHIDKSIQEIETLIKNIEKKYSKKKNKPAKKSSNKKKSRKRK